MSRPLTSRLGLALVLSLTPLGTLIACSGDDDSTATRQENGGDRIYLDGAGPDDTGGVNARGGTGGHVTSTGGTAAGVGGQEATAGETATAGVPAVGGGGAGGAGGDASEPSEAGPIKAGPYALAYTSLPGTDGNERSSVTATFGQNSELTGYVYSAGTEDPTIGTNTASEQYMDATAALGRWSGGTAGGHYFSSTLTWTANQGLHYAIGIPTPDGGFPASGTTDYVILGATHPTSYPNTVAPGTVTGGSAKVTWGGPVAVISLTLTITTDKGDYALATTGNNDPSGYALEPDKWAGTVPATGSGVVCLGTNCQGRFEGFIAGSNGQRLGAEYYITAGGTANTVRGAVLFGKKK